MAGLGVFKFLLLPLYLVRFYIFRGSRLAGGCIFLFTPCVKIDFIISPLADSPFLL